MIEGMETCGIVQIQVLFPLDKVQNSVRSDVCYQLQIINFHKIQKTLSKSRIFHQNISQCSDENPKILCWFGALGYQSHKHSPLLQTALNKVIHPRMKDLEIH